MTPTLLNGVFYAITINFDDKHQYFNKPNRYKECIESQNSIIQQAFKEYAEFTLYPELSINGRWHYHGIILFHNIGEYLLEKAHRIGGSKYPFNMKLTDITDHEKWVDYYTKQSAVMKPLIKSKRAPYRIERGTTYYYRTKALE